MMPSAGLLSSHMAMMRMIIIIIKTQENEQGFALISKKRRKSGDTRNFANINLYVTFY